MLSSSEFLLFHFLAVLKLIILHFHYVHIYSCGRQLTKDVNRLRPMTQNPHICATWDESGHVQVRLFNHMIYHPILRSLQVLKLYLFSIMDFNSKSDLYWYVKV